MKKLNLLLFIFSILMISCNTNSSSSSSNKKCDDMRAYNAGVETAEDNKNMLADCDYFWQMDDDGEMSKSCYCKGYNSVEKAY